MLTKIVVLLAVFLVAGIQCKAVGPNDQRALTSSREIYQRQDHRGGVGAACPFHLGLAMQRSDYVMFVNTTDIEEFTYIVQ